MLSEQNNAILLHSDNGLDATIHITINVRHYKVVLSFIYGHNQSRWGGGVVEESQ